MTTDRGEPKILPVTGSISSPGTLEHRSGAKYDPRTPFGAVGVEETGIPVVVVMGRYERVPAATVATRGSMVNVTVAVDCQRVEPDPPDTVTTNEPVPETFGVPERTPVLESMVMPFGAPVTDHVAPDAYIAASEPFGVVLGEMALMAFASVPVSCP